MIPGLGSLAFGFPWALAALALLPVIWWLLRFTPPRPRRIRFPALRLLFGLASKDETPHKSPWWLTALRTLIAVLAILALAEPVLNPQRLLADRTGPLVVIVDDGWAAAPQWERRRTLLGEILGEAETAGRPALLVTTTPRPRTRDFALANPRELKARAAALAPVPLRPARPALAAALGKTLSGLARPEIVWLADGLDYGEADAFLEALLKASPQARISVFLDPPSDAVLALRPPETAERGLTVEVLRPAGRGTRTGRIRALALNGRSLGEAEFDFAAGETRTIASFELPLALRNQLARLQIAEMRSPAATYLLDDRWRRKPVGLVSGAASESAQPLLSPLYYVERALAPYTELRRAPRGKETTAIGNLIAGGLSVLVLADIGQLVARDERRVADWVEAGGMLVRFAGPRLARADDGLIPVRLRRGGRALGGALSWSKPQTLSAFPGQSPFARIEPPADVFVERQVLAEPTAELESRVWARLSDGTPLVTAAARGNGMIVLFHVPANPEWSNLPMSGLFVEMLRRIVEMSLGVAAGGPAAAQTATAAFETLPPLRSLDGFARLAEPPAEAQPIDAREFAAVRVGPQHPPGLYGTESRFRALNVTDVRFALRALERLPQGATSQPYVSEEATPLKAPLLLAAFALLLADGLAVLMLAGRLRRRRRTKAAAGLAALALAAAVAAPATPLRAQETALSPELTFALRATRETHLAYVITGRASVDAASRAGLRGLNEVLINRTALEPGEPIGVDIERDELVFFPLVYWPLTGDTPTPSDKALARIDAYMKNGGTILFDTRDNRQTLPGVRSDLLSPETQALRRILGRLDIPPLEVVPADHVLTKAFYLLQSFPGRWAGGQLWVEAEAGGEDGEANQRNPRNPDGVSAIVIGANDYAAAWAVDTRGRQIFPVVPGGPRQRELAYRTGVNIVMYALTGNYKADQVHVPALLERLGQ